jgi:hypothetical protein
MMPNVRRRNDHKCFMLPSTFAVLKAEKCNSHNSLWYFGGRVTDSILGQPTKLRVTPRLTIVVTRRGDDTGSSPPH